jgi:uncharacterized protein
MSSVGSSFRLESHGLCYVSHFIWPSASVAWNPARFLNYSCVPNCEAVIVRERIWLYALRRIKAGEELTYNYGLGLGGFEERPCHCGASACVGFMVDEPYFAAVRHRRGQA